MEPTTQAQFDRTNILMKEFVDTVFHFTTRLCHNKWLIFDEK